MGQGDFFSFNSFERDQGNTDLNGDNDTSDFILHCTTPFPGNQLGSFIYLVEAQADKQITASDASLWIDMALEVTAGL